MSLRRWLSVLGVLVLALLALARGHAAGGVPLPGPLPQGEGNSGDPLPRGEGTAAPRAVTYRAFLPTAFHNACPGGAIVDDFSNPDSGWPDFDETGGNAGYVDTWFSPAYGIGLVTHHFQLVSRGDHWANSRRLQVMVEYDGAQIGGFGLALGINDNGRTYTAAMIDVEHSLLRLVHYTDTQRTQLGEWPYVDTDRDGTVMTVTGDPATGQATLNVAGELDIPLPDITGGIGFVAHAGRGRIEAYYDDYVFVDAYCGE